MHKVNAHEKDDYSTLHYCGYTSYNCVSCNSKHVNNVEAARLRGKGKKRTSEEVALELEGHEQFVLSRGGKKGRSN